MEQTKLFKSLIEKSNKIVITTHMHPDADGIGSEISICLALRTLGKNAICVNEEPLLGRYKYLDPQNVIISFDQFQQMKDSSVCDLLIVTDTNSLPRTGNRVQNLVSRSKNLLFIDHHPCPSELAAIHCIDTTMAATGELVGKLIESLDIKFTKELALPLYTSILMDTSSFRYPTVTGDTHRLIGRLMDSGISPPFAYNKIYGAKKISYMLLLGQVLSSAHAVEDQSIAWLILNESDLKKYNVDPEDTHGFVNHLLILENIKIACMFRQSNHDIKISFRSVGSIDVGVMAQALGGGGHDHSAGTIIEGDLAEVVPDVIDKLKVMLKSIQ